MNSSEITYFKELGFEFVKVIAQGGYGVVFEVYSEKFNSSYAIKKIPKCFLSQAELDCLMQIDDVRVVRLYQVFVLGDFIYMLMELCKTDLNQIFTFTDELSDQTMQKYASEMVLAIKSIHDRNIAHCDVKPANFFIDSYGRMKIGDFGLASFNGATCPCKMQKGTKLFMAPEMYVLKQYNAMKADIWSLGISLYYMATKTYPFNSPDPTKIPQLVNIGLFPKERVTNKHLRKVICRCLERNPDKRPSIYEVMKMPFIHEILAKKQVCCKFCTAKQQKPGNQIVKPGLPKRNSICSFASNLHLTCFKGSPIRLINSERKIQHVCL